MNIIQSLWIGDSLSIVEQLCIRSFLYHNHEFHLYTYGDVKNIPEGTTVLDAEEILPEELIFRTKAGSLAPFADWLRWELLRKKGEFWVDMDIIALKAFSFKDDFIWGNELDGISNIAVLKLPKGHFLTEQMAMSSEKPNRYLPYDSMDSIVRKTYRYLKGNKRADTPWGEASGPRGFTNLINHYGFSDKSKPIDYFYPIPYAQYQSIFDDTYPDGFDKFTSSYGVHLWNEVIRRDKFDVIRESSDDSFFSKMCEKYGL